MTTQYTSDQIKDITTREAQGLEALKALQLTPACAVQKINIGNDVFADRVSAYLQDTKYSLTTTAGGDLATDEVALVDDAPVKTDDAPIMNSNGCINIK
jgi:hypothetical protein